jgi:dGTPase
MGRRLLYESIRRMLGPGLRRDRRHAPPSRPPRRRTPTPRAAGAAGVFCVAMRAQSTALKRFLFANLYRHPQVLDTTTRGQQVVRELFATYLATPGELPPEFADGADRPRVADYIAGMTDRFALREHERLTGQRLFA